MKKCPYCAEDIQDEAVKCKHCGEWIEEKQEKKKTSTENSPQEYLSHLALSIDNKFSVDNGWMFFEGKQYPLKTIKEIALIKSSEFKQINIFVLQKTEIAKRAYGLRSLLDSWLS